MPRARWIGAVVSLAGVGVLTAPGAGDVTTLGVLLLAATGAAWALYTAAGRTVTDPRAATTGNFTVLAVVLLIPVGFTVTGGPDVTVSGLLLAAAMGSLTTAFAYVAWYACQRRMSATTAGSVQLVIPILTAAGAMLLLGERLTLLFVVAALLVFAGPWVGRPRQLGTETTAGAALRSRYTPPVVWGRGLVLAAPRGHHGPWLPGSRRVDPYHRRTDIGSRVPPHGRVSGSDRPTRTPSPPVLPA